MPEKKLNIFIQEDTIGLTLDQSEDALRHSKNLGRIKLPRDTRETVQKKYRLGYVRISDLHNPDKREEMLQHIENCFSADNMRQLKRLALDHEAAVKANMFVCHGSSRDFDMIYDRDGLDAAQKNEIGKLFPFLSREVRDDIFDKLRNKKEDEYAEPLVRVYTALLKRPDLSVDTIFAPLAAMLAADSSEALYPGMIADLYKTEKLVTDPRAHAQALLREMEMQKNGEYTLGWSIRSGLRQKQMEMFRADFEEMPRFIQAAAEAMDTTALITVYNLGNVNAFVPALSDNRRAKGCSDGRLVYVDVGQLGDHATVSEEITHHVERHLSDYFTRKEAWRKAVILDLKNTVKYRAVQKLRDIYEKYIPPAQKENSCFNTLKHKNERVIFVEALPDIVHLEYALKDTMRREGNLQSAGFAADASIDDVMNAALPNLWKLYRGMQGKAMFQKQSGEVAVMERGMPTPPGAQPVSSFAEECATYVKRHTGKDISIEEKELFIKGSAKRSADWVKIADSQPQGRQFGF